MRDRRAESHGRPACTCRTARAVSPDGTVVTVRKSSAIGATTRLRSSPSTSQWHRQRVTTVHQRRAIRASTLRQPAQPSYFSGPFLPSHAGQPSVRHANQPCSWHAATGSSERACTPTPHSQSAPPQNRHSKLTHWRPLHPGGELPDAPRAHLPCDKQPVQSVLVLAGVLLLHAPGPAHAFTIGAGQRRAKA